MSRVSSFTLGLMVHLRRAVVVLSALSTASASISVGFSQTQNQDSLQQFQNTQTTADLFGNENQTHGDGMLTLSKPIALSLSLGAYPFIASGSIRYFVSARIGIEATLHSVLALFAYKARGLSMGLRYVLQPEKNFSPYISGGLGVLWRVDEGDNGVRGTILITQFGLTYVSDHGFNMFLALGPTFLFLSSENTRVPILSIGFGWSF